tara:strand:- start:18796 stop:19881 length:1086 start_codon:yes stop_codon:yes gene_type:complete
MSTLHEYNRAIFTQLKKDYDALSWFGKLFFPSALATKLTEINDSEISTKNAFDIYQTYTQHTWFFHKWFLSPLSRFSNTDFCRALNTLQAETFFTRADAQANFDVVAGSPNPAGAAKALQELQRHLLLYSRSHQKNRDAITNHDKPIEVAHALITLKEVGLLNQDRNIPPETSEETRAYYPSPFLPESFASPRKTYQEEMNQHPHPELAAACLVELHKNKLLSAKHASVVFNQKDPTTLKSLHDAIDSLKRSRLLSQPDVVTAVSKNNDPRSAALALSYLNDKNLLSQENIESVCSAERPSKTAHDLIQRVTREDQNNTSVPNTSQTQPSTSPHFFKSNNTLDPTSSSEPEPSNSTHRPGS